MTRQQESDELIRRIRELYDLPQETNKRRICLACGEAFTSHGSYDRMCSGCGRSSKSYPYDRPYVLPE